MVAFHTPPVTPTQAIDALGAPSSDGGACIAAWTHCSNDQICAFPEGQAPDTVPLATFNAWGDFLDANPTDVLVIGFSDVFAGPWGSCPGMGLVLLLTVLIDAPFDCSFFPFHSSATMPTQAPTR